jgi:hypothetical protein
MVEKQMMGEVLVELGLIDEHRLRHALGVARKEKLKLGVRCSSVSDISMKSRCSIFSRTSPVS